ncbi:MAG: sialate O-acetylesterase [Armatimonadetes bacterium]|nr:sialate O-acetylesterase [Armatimonadota bacterium]
MRIRIITTAMIWLQVGAAWAAITPNSLFTDGAVLQQGMSVPIWGTANDGERVTVRFQDQAASTIAQYGRWMVRLNPLKVGGPFTMTISGENKIELKNVLVGEVWLCSGQSNAAFRLGSATNADEVIANSENEMLRLYTVPDARGYRMKGFDPLPGSGVESAWVEADPTTTSVFSAFGYFFGRDLQRAMRMPIGVIKSTVGDSVTEEWTRRGVLKPELEASDSRTDPGARRYKVGKFYKTGHLYDAQIAPIMPYAVRGVVWYQGESNVGSGLENELRDRTDPGIVHRTGFEYRYTFPIMIKNWREDWGEGDFPFLFVQLLPFFRQAPGAKDIPNIPTEPGESLWAELRESQLLTSQRVQRTGMITTADLGDPNDIHPANKEPIGARLALAARSLVYKQKVEYTGPIYKSMKVKKDRIIVSLNHIGGGLVAKSGELTGFTIAGKDRKFVNARAEIQGKNVVVWSPQVPQPVAVRYGWADYPILNLFNKEGFPASPFRTDKFPTLSGPR